MLETFILLRCNTAPSLTCLSSGLRGNHFSSLDEEGLSLMSPDAHTCEHIRLVWPRVSKSQRRFEEFVLHVKSCNCHDIAQEMRKPQNHTEPFTNKHSASKRTESDHRWVRSPLLLLLSFSLLFCCLISHRHGDRTKPVCDTEAQKIPLVFPVESGVILSECTLRATFCAQGCDRILALQAHCRYQNTASLGIFRASST